jgi:perosamine synthetase
VIRLAVPDVDEADIAAAAAVLRTGFLVQGAEVRRFEEAIAARVARPHAAVVSNGTAALHLALQALGVGPGSVVAVAAYSWPATANAVVLCGALPVFVDVDARTGNMCPDALTTVLRDHPEARAVLPVHTFGRMADMPRLAAVAAAHGARVLEDAACALGAAISGRPAGAWGDAACFSFHPRKTITTGEGGAVTTGDARVDWQVRTLRNHGLDPNAATPDFVLAGYNLRLTEFQAALGSSQLARLDALIALRRGHAARYDALLADGPVTAPPPAEERESHVFQSYVVTLPREVAPRRPELLAHLRAAGVEATIGTYHMPLIRYYRERFGFAPGDFPATDDVSARALTLPLHRQLSADQQAQVVAALIDGVEALG